MTRKVKVTRINSGIYDVTIDGIARYELERFPDGSWLTFKPMGIHRPREYMQDYRSKRAAIADLRENG